MDRFITEGETGRKGGVEQLHLKSDITVVHSEPSKRNIGISKSIPSGPDSEKKYSSEKLLDLP